MWRGVTCAKRSEQATWNHEPGYISEAWTGWAAATWGKPEGKKRLETWKGRMSKWGCCGLRLRYLISRCRLWRPAGIKEANQTEGNAKCSDCVTSWVRRGRRWSLQTQRRRSSRGNSDDKNKTCARQTNDRAWSCQVAAFYCIWKRTLEGTDGNTAFRSEKGTLESMLTPSAFRMKDVRPSFQTEARLWPGIWHGFDGRGWTLPRKDSAGIQDLTWTVLKCRCLLPFLFEDRSLQRNDFEM